MDEIGPLTWDMLSVHEQTHVLHHFGEVDIESWEILYGEYYRVGQSILLDEGVNALGAIEAP